MPQKGKYKYTTDEFQKIIAKIDDNVILIGEYVGNRNPIEVKCKICDYHWKPLACNLSKGQTGCPCCLGMVAVKGINSFYDTHQHLAILLKNIEDSYTHLKYSKDIVDWVCPNCNSIIKKSFEKVTQTGHLSCTFCNDGLSYPNKFMASMLKQLNITFSTEKTFDWSDGKRYDFYLDELDCIIEMHGGQHYSKSGFHYGLKYQQENDFQKRKNALDNGIQFYIEIDSRNSNKDYISKNILESQLSLLLDLSDVNWDDCAIDSITSLKMKACDLWNNGVRNTTEIGKKLGIHQKTVRSYLKECANLHMCDYDSYEAMVANGKNANPSNKRKIICTTTNELFESIASAVRKYNISSNCNIISCCQGKRNYAGTLPDGTPLKWKYVS